MVFLNQTGCNLEVYIDNKILKTFKEIIHYKDLDGILNSIRRNNIRLKDEVEE